VEFFPACCCLHSEKFLVSQLIAEAKIATGVFPDNPLFFKVAIPKTGILLEKFTI